MEQSRVKDFFREVEVVPFKALPTVLMVGMAYLEEGTNINSQAIFENVQIYEIPNYVRGKNQEVKIPYPGLPYVVLSAKFGLQIRGIVKDLKDLKAREGNKGKFPNQVTLDIALRDKVVNVMIFGDSMKVSGALTIDHLTETFIFVKALLLSMQNDLNYQVQKLNEANVINGQLVEGRTLVPGIKLFDKSPLLTSLSISMVNVVFDLGFRIQKDELSKKAAEAGLFCPPEVTKDAVRVLIPMEGGKAKGGARYFNFRIMHTGKVVYSGNNRKAMEAPYDKFMDFIKANEGDIRFY